MLNKDNHPPLQPQMDAVAGDKRRHPRFSVELPLDYSDVNGKEIHGGIVANASEGGLLVYLPERIEVGKLLKIEILYVKGLDLETIKATAKIVWSDLATAESLREHRYGLQFQFIEQRDFGRLVSLLKEVSTLQI